MANFSAERYILYREVIICELTLFKPKMQLLFLNKIEIFISLLFETSTILILLVNLLTLVVKYNGRTLTIFDAKGDEDLFKLQKLK